VHSTKQDCGFVTRTSIPQGRPSIAVLSHCIVISTLHCLASPNTSCPTAIIEITPALTINKTWPPAINGAPGSFPPLRPF